MSRRSVVVVVAAVVLALVLVSASALLLSRDSDAAAAGDQIAFSCKEQNNTWYAVCASKVDGSDRRRLTRMVHTSTPAWSPDGQQIAFTRNEDVGEFTTFSEDDVFVMDADGDDQRQLTPERDGRHAGQPTWSPDGRHIAYIQGQGVPSGLPSRPGSLFVMDSDGGNVRRLTRGDADVDPAWSPDGTEIAYSHCFNIDSLILCTLDLFVIDVATGATRRLTRTPLTYEAGPTWSPDSSRIAFTRFIPSTDVNPSASIYVIDRAGKGETLQHEHESYVGGLYSLAWSPDGRTLAFVTSPNRECTAISLLNVGGREVRPLTSCERERESTRSPTWQPDTDAPNVP